MTLIQRIEINLMEEIREYTASFILDMRGNTDTVDAVKDRLVALISELGGQVSNVENLGQKDFERVADKKFSNGIYIQIMFSGNPSIPEGIRTKLQLDRTINRIFIEVRK